MVGKDPSLLGLPCRPRSSGIRVLRMEGVMMSKSLRLVLPIAVLVIAAIGLSASGAPASPPAPVGGSYVYTDSWFESFRSAGGNAIIGLRATVEYTGTLIGTSEVRGKLIAHA